MGAVGAVSACNTVGYLAHLGAGQMSVIWNREPLTPARVAGFEPDEREGLATLQRAVAFAASIGLSETSSYRHVIDDRERGPIHVVVACRADRLEAVSWWFPIAGRVAYRGFFDRARADAFATEMAADDLDVYQRPAALYSTLGWFDDPFPRTMLRWPQTRLFETAVHEIVHETVYLPGDTGYNEGLATFIGHQATLLAYADRPDLARDAIDLLADRQTFAALLNDLRAELEALYLETRELAPEDSLVRALAAREPIFARFQGPAYAKRAWRTTRYDGFRRLELSNAYLVAQNTYLGELACFERELATLDNDLVAFIAAHVETPGRHVEGCGP